jgi:hypothetical protein
MNLKRPTDLLAVAVLALSASSAQAAWPSPRAAGFHHCALIYDRPARSESDLKPYVTDGRRYLFDAFLFLIQRSGRDIRTEYGETQKEDWEYQFQQWFGPGRDLAALDAAVAATAKRLGPPPANRRIILSIPYPNPLVKDFGDVDGDGLSEDLSTPAGRRTVLQWFSDECRRRFREAGYRHLTLWGLYWMREDLGPDDGPFCRAAADIVHQAGLKLLWIPYNGAPGWERWRECGIDVAILQPNLAFGTWQNGGAMGREQLALTASLARARGMGVEMEANNIAGSESDRRTFLQYLCDGAPSRYGYQTGATAYYLGVDSVERTAGSTDPRVRRAYTALADYVCNKPVPDPDPKTAWKWRAAGDARVAEARFAKSRPLAMTDLFFKASGGEWRGTMVVEVMRPGSREWTPGGYAIRSTQAGGIGPVRRLSAPVGGDVTAVRLTLKTAPGSPPISVAGIDLDPNGPRPLKGLLAVGKPYRMAGVASKYGDSGSELTDGVVPDDGFASGRSVGWRSGGGQVAVAFDLGRVMPVQSIEVECQGGGAYAVNWPGSPQALLSATAPPPWASSGRGPMPAGFTTLAGGAPKVTRSRAEQDLDGVVTFTASKGIPARYVTLLFEANGWLMLSEVRILADGRNVAPESTYALRPLPSPPDDARYADDGALLTDGVVSEGFAPRRLVGWQDTGPRDVTVDLGAVQPVQAVTVWSLKGGEAGIVAPREVAVDVSTDGVSFAPLGAPVRPDREDRMGVAETVGYRIAAARETAARYVRVRVASGGEWTMLSEIEVE